jgi:hypothetical protein
MMFVVAEETFSRWKSGFPPVGAAQNGVMPLLTV